MSVKMRTSKKQGLAVEIPVFTKVEQKSDGGFTRVAQRTDVIQIALLMDYELDGRQLSADTTKVVVRGDAGLTHWAKKPYCIEGREFCLCPEADVIAVVETAPPQGNTGGRRNIMMDYP